MQSLDRFITILEVVAANNQPTSAAEVSTTTGLSMSTVSRLMLELTDSGLLYRNARDRRYTLGPRLYALAGAAGSQLDVVEVARPLLERLRNATGETVSLHVLRGDQRVCIAEVPSRELVRRVVPVGLAEPVRGSATGAVLLAETTAGERDAILAGMDLAPAELEEFEGVIAHAREHGWAIVSDRWVSGLTGLSAPVIGSDGFRAAISASGPSVRFTREIALEHVDEIREVADAVSARLGHRAS